MDDPNTSNATSSVPRLVGRKWEAIIDGKRALNGERYGANFRGEILMADDDHSVYEVIRQLADHLEEENAEMEFPDAIQITFLPPNTD